MKKAILVLLLILFSSFIPMDSPNTIEQQPQFVKYQNWTIVYNKGCETKRNQNCVDFYWAVSKSINKLYNPQDGKYYYYYRLYVQSNSVYSNGKWAYTKLNDIDFKLNGVMVANEPYFLFREKALICTFWHPTDTKAKIEFSWKDCTIY